MKDTTNRNLMIGSFVLVVVVIVWAIMQKKAKEAELASIKDAIDRGDGVNQFDIDSVLAPIGGDASFGAAKSEALKLKNAKGWLRDDDAAVFAVLRNKTKGQLKQISNEMISLTGLTLGQFINDIFSQVWDSGKIKTAFNIVQNAL